MDPNEAPRSDRPFPTTGDSGELLANPPAGRPPTALAGYRAGKTVRWTLGVLVLVAIAAAAWAVMGSQRPAASTPVVPHYQVTPDSDEQGRTAQLVWSDGPARLGLSRQSPGVREILLPDRRLRLADGYDQAQVKVDVVDGKTITLKVLSGQIEELPP